ncbi:MAG: polymer-forming cytoskeletal protein [Polyangiales bacterium]
MSDESTPLSPRAMQAQAGEINALLGRGTRFAGKLTFQGKVRIDGTFEGEIFSDGVLIVGDEAVVTASTIEVGTLIVRGGVVRGDITARAAVEVYAPSRIYGSIAAVEVFIDKGVVFEGQCRMLERED